MTKTQTTYALIPQSFDEGQDMARNYAESNLLPIELRGKEADVFV